MKSLNSVEASVRSRLITYSLNHEIAVREGQRIKLGGLLAKVARPVGLHFEIRRDGDPVG